MKKCSGGRKSAQNPSLTSLRNYHLDGAILTLTNPWNVFTIYIIINKGHIKQSHLKLQHYFLKISKNLVINN